MFQFAWPWLLILIPLPWLIKFLRQEDKIRLQQSAIKLPHLTTQPIKPLMSGFHHFWRQPKFWWAFVIWSLLIIAIAGPQWLGEPVQMPQEGRNILLAIDISGSMQTPDMTLNNHSVSRLQMVKHVADQFIESRKGDRIGLILFGTRAYLQTPLTFDRKTVMNMLQDATVGLAGPQTAIGDAIGLAVKRLQKYPENSRVLVLMTDGANNAGNIPPMVAAGIAKKFHIKIYTIGLGADQMRIQGFFGPQMVNPSSDLDTRTLTSIANETGGLFFRAKNTFALQKIYEQLNKLEPIKEKQTLFRPVIQLYPWVLTFALFIWLLRILFLRGIFPTRIIQKEEV